MAIEKFPDEISTIRTLLSENPEGLTIRSISAMLGMNRNSAAKYLGMLQMQGSVILKRDGSSKVYCLANMLPAAAVLKLTKSHVILFDQSLTAVNLNDSMLDLLKILKEDFIGKTVDQLPLSVQSHPALSALIEQALSGKESRNSAVIKNEDQFIPCMLTISPVYFENGDNGVSVVLDCQPDQDNQGYTRTIGGNGTVNGINNTVIIELDEIEYICQFGPDKTLTFVNNAYCGMMQKSKDELIGQNWQPVILEKESRKIQKSLASLDPANPVQTTEFLMITPGGESRWQQWKFRGMFDNTGQIIQYQGIGLDITSRKKLEEKLRQQENELEILAREHKNEILELNRQIYTEISAAEKKDFQLQFTQFSMDNASYMIIWTNKEGQFVYMNKKAQEVLGYPRRQLLTRKMDGILSPDTPFNWEEIWKHIEQDRNFTIESSFQTKDKGEVPVEIVFNYLLFKEKKYCCCFAKDITEKKQIEEAKHESERRFGVIFHSTFEFIALLQPDGTVVEVNETALRFGGLALSDAIGKPFWETHWWSISTQTKVQLRNAIVRAAGGLSVQYIVDVMGEGNKIATIDFSLKPVTGDSGMVTSIIAEGRDITERIQYADALRVSEGRYHSLFENMLEGYAYCELLFDREVPNDFVYIEVNSAFEKLTGLKNVAGKRVSEVLPGIHASNPELLRIYSRVAMSGKTEKFETYLSLQEYYISITVYSQKEGFFSVMFENITDRKRSEAAILKNSEELHAANMQLTAQEEELRFTLNNLSSSQQALRVSERKYRDMFEQSVLGLFKSSTEGSLIDVNDAFARMYGYSGAAEMLNASLNFGRNLYANPNERKEVLRILAEQGKIENYEILHLRRNGTRFWVSITARTIRDLNGSGMFNEGTIIDITARKDAEMAQQLHGEIVQNMAEGVVLVRATDGEIVYANPRFENMFRYEPDELTGRHISSLIAPDARSPQIIADEIISNLRQSGVWSGEVLNLRKDGSTFWCNATVSTFDHPQYGTVWVSVQMDISVQKQAKEALRIREHDFSTLVENSTDIIVRFDAAMRYIYCNPAVERQLGIPFHQLLGKSPLESGISVEQSRFIVTSLQKTLETGMEQEVEQPVPTPSGLRHFLTRIVPERDDDGSIVSLLAITRDITERKLNEDDFRQKTYQQLQASFETLQKTEANLRLHQTELEVQNEELRQVQLSLEVSRQRYFELYDLAPAGYLTLSGKGLILHANLTAATLLGVERHQLEEKPFTRYIVPDDQDIFYHCRKKLVDTKKRQSCELRMLHGLVTPFRVQIIAVPAPAGEGDESSISLMMIDIPGPETEKETLAGEQIPCR